MACSTWLLSIRRRLYFPGDPAADDRRYLHRQQFNGLSDFAVWQPANIDLGHETVVTEHLVLVEQLVNDLLWAADKVSAFQAGFPLVLAAGKLKQNSPAAAELVEVMAVVGIKLVDRLLRCFLDVQVTGHAGFQLGRGMTCFCTCAAVEIHQRFELSGSAADDGDNHGQSQGCGPHHALRSAANPHPDWQ